jgi:hypothetical protein
MEVPALLGDVAQVRPGLPERIVMNRLPDNACEAHERSVVSGRPFLLTQDFRR